MLWADCGLGKTIITLTSIVRLVNTCQLRGVLIVAPMRVCQLVWEKEAKKWAHTQGLTFGCLFESRDVRSRVLTQQYDIYLINYAKLKWLSEAIKKLKRPPPFDGVVWDEITKLKNSTTQRVRSVAKFLHHTQWRTGLTATPASAGLQDLHGQYLVTDLGKRLGTNKTEFMSRYFYKKGPYRIVPFSDTPARVKSKISDMTMEMSAADYNPLPDLIYNDVYIDLPPTIRKKYEQLEEEFFCQLESGDDIEVHNEASLYNKCLQLTNGAVILEPGEPEWEEVHEEKLKALDDIVDGTGDEPLLIAYNYRADAQRIMERFKHLDPLNITACKTKKQSQNFMRLWCDHKLKIAIGHPASCGHGVDELQTVGNNLVWFGLNWSLDLFTQFNGRLRRQGSDGKPVICHRILGRDTLDDLQRLRLQSRSDDEAALRKAVSEYKGSKGV